MSSVVYTIIAFNQTPNDRTLSMKRIDLFKFSIIKTNTLYSIGAVLVV